MIISQNHPGFSEMQNVKRRFFAMRNGIVADALRKGGDIHRIIFGLTLVQLKEIASVTPHSADLARLLWANDSTRCSRLLAPMLMPSDSVTAEEGYQMLYNVLTAEEADILCHSLLRKLADAASIASSVLQSGDTPLRRYAALRLYFNVVNSNPKSALEAARQLIDDPVPYVANLAANLAEEAEYILESRE